MAKSTKVKATASGKNPVIPKGSHRMPNGKIMKDGDHKKTKKKR